MEAGGNKLNLFFKLAGLRRRRGKKSACLVHIVPQRAAISLDKLAVAVQASGAEVPAHC